MRCSLAGIEWRRLRMVTDSYLSQNLKWLRVKSTIDLMSPTKIDPQSGYKKNQNEISWGGRVLPGRVRELRKLGKMRRTGRTGLVLFCWALARKNGVAVLIHPTCLRYPGMTIRIEDGQKPTVKFFWLPYFRNMEGSLRVLSPNHCCCFLFWMPRWLVTMREVIG